MVKDNAKDINYIANKAKNEINKIEELKTIVDADNLDEQIVNDFLEGETQTFEILDIIYNEINEREILLAGLKEHIENMNARKKRLDGGVKKLKAVMGFVLKRSNQKSFVRPQYTVSLKSTPEKLLVEDESLIPSSYFKVEAPKLDASALKKALQAGGEVEGASLTDKGFTIQIRNK